MYMPRPRGLSEKALKYRKIRQTDSLWCKKRLRYNFWGDLVPNIEKKGNSGFRLAVCKPYRAGPANKR